MSSTEPEIDIHARRRRACYRAWHRGMLEMDMIMGPFADAHVPGYGESELVRFEALMDESDADLLSWIMGREQPGPDVDAKLVSQLAAFQLARAAKK